MRPWHLSFTVGVVGGIASMPPAARAQDVVERVDIEVPVVVLDDAVGVAGPASGDAELDLANIVQSAAKGVTTVQEAPAIVTVVTQDEIRDRQLQTFEQIIDTVPGWIRLGAVHSQFPFPLARGQIQAAQLLHDGVSMFDPYVNNTMFNRIQSVELIKRIELITGPGGVLWGSNSLMGIVNVITKDAEDVDGVEVGGQIGDGNGDRRMARAYLMVGAPELFGGKAKLFVHGAVDTFIGPGFEMAQHQFSSPLPQPNSPNIHGPLTTGEPDRSYLLNLHTKLSIGKLQLRVHFPWAERHTPLGFPGDAVRAKLPEDTLRNPDGSLACPNMEPYDVADDECTDKGRVGRNNEVNFYDRYGVAEYRTRFAGGRAGATARLYLAQFVRYFPSILVLAPLKTINEGGLAFELDLTTYRLGGVYDGDVELPYDVRLLYGVEGFREWFTDNTTQSRQGAGRESLFQAPYNLERLPLLCPRDLDPETGAVFIMPGCPLTNGFVSNRVVLGAYVNPQWRPSRRLMLDLGGRVQVSPESLGDLGYSVTPTFGASIVYNLIPNWHLKINATQGFRPPVFNNLISNGESIQIDGREDLEVETSTAGQAEINARIFKGERRLRELSFRADYSYTFLENLIQIIGGRYENTADRGIHSVEFLGKLYVQGGHRVELGYTWLKILTEDLGVGRTIPENWFTMAAVFSLVENKLEATSTLRVLGAMEDPNRLVEHRAMRYDERGRTVDAEGTETSLIVGPSELVLDRLPPAADIMFGVQWVALPGLHVAATVHNAFNARYYQPDAFSSYEPRLEYLPNPIEDIRAYVSARYQY